MEEAYTQLYQEFIRLRSLCLKQAALLQQLQETLSNQQATRNVNHTQGFARDQRSAVTFHVGSSLSAGCPVPNGDADNMVSIPVQCTHQIPAPLRDGPDPPKASTQTPRAHHGRDEPTGSGGVFASLAEDMGALGLNFTSPGGNQRAPEPSVKEETFHLFRMPWACSSTHDTDLLSHPGGYLMSEVALQSQVCEFCQAAFPGYTTTRGEFLHHLHTHIT